MERGNCKHCTSIVLSLDLPVVFNEFDRNIWRQRSGGSLRMRGRDVV